MSELFASFTTTYTDPDPRMMAALFGTAPATFEVTIDTTHYPTAGEDARRIVRHGMAGVLAWLGEPVGPEPGEPTRTAVIMPNCTLTTATAES